MGRGRSQRALGSPPEHPPHTLPPSSEGTCSRKGAPGTRCRLVWLRSTEKGDDTKRQDVSSASSISPPARQGQRWREARERGRRARGCGHVFPAHGTASSSGPRPLPFTCMSAEQQRTQHTDGAQRVCRRCMDGREKYTETRKVFLPQKPPRSILGERQSPRPSLALGPS